MLQISRGLMVLAFIGYSVEVFAAEKEAEITHYLLPLIPAKEGNILFSVHTKGDLAKYCESHVQKDTKTNNPETYVIGDWVSLTKSEEDQSVFVYTCEYKGFLRGQDHKGKIEYTIDKRSASFSTNSGHVVELALKDTTDDDTEEKLYAVIISKESNQKRDDLKDYLNKLRTKRGKYFTKEALALSAEATAEAIKAADPEQNGQAEGIRILTSGEIRGLVALEGTKNGDAQSFLVHIICTASVKNYGLRRPWIVAEGNTYAIIAQDRQMTKAVVGVVPEGTVQKLVLGKTDMYVLRVSKNQNNEMTKMLDSLFHEAGFFEKLITRERAMNSFFSCYADNGIDMATLKDDYVLISDLGGDLINARIECPNKPKVYLKEQADRSFLLRAKEATVTIKDKKDGQIQYMADVENGNEGAKNLRQYVSTNDNTKPVFVRVTKLANLFQDLSPSSTGYKIVLGKDIGHGANSPFPEKALYLEWEKEDEKLKAVAAYVIRYNVRVQFCSLHNSNRHKQPEKECFLHAKEGDEIGIEYSRDHSKNTNVFAYGKQGTGNTLRLVRGPHMKYSFSDGVTSVRAWGAVSFEDDDSEHLRFQISKGGELFHEYHDLTYKTRGECYSESPIKKGMDLAGQTVELREDSSIIKDWVARRTLPDTAEQDKMYSMSPRIKKQDGKFVITGLADWKSYYIDGDTAKEVKANAETGESDPIDIATLSVDTFMLAAPRKFRSARIIAMANKVGDDWEDEFEFAVKWDIRRVYAPNNFVFDGGNPGDIINSWDDPATAEVELKVYLLSEADQKTIDDAAETVDSAESELKELEVTDNEIDPWKFKYSKKSFAYFNQEYERRTGNQVAAVQILDENGQDVAVDQTLDDEWDDLIIKGKTLVVVPGEPSQAVRELKIDPAGLADRDAKLDKIADAFRVDLGLESDCTVDCDAADDAADDGRRKTVEGCNAADCADTIFFCRVVKKTAREGSTKPSDPENEDSDTWFYIVVIAGCACVAAVAIGIYLWCRRPMEESSLSTEAKVELSASMNAMYSNVEIADKQSDDPVSASMTCMNACMSLSNIEIAADKQSDDPVSASMTCIEITDEQSDDPVSASMTCMNACVSLSNIEIADKQSDEPVSASMTCMNACMSL